MNRACQTSAGRMMLWALALCTACGTDAREPAAPPASLRQGLMAADLSITGTLQNSGDPRDYTLTYTIENQGNADAANVKVTFLLDSGVSVRTLGGQSWSCESGAPGVDCTLVTLAVGAQSQLTLDLEVPYGQTNATVTATVDSDAADPTLGANSASLVLAGSSQTLHLIGGGIGCSLVHRMTAAEGPLLTLLIALLGFVSLHRRRTKAA